MWQTGATGPSQAYFASNLIRDRLIVEIDVLTSLNLGKDINKVVGKVADHVDVPLLIEGSLISEFDILTKDRLTPLKNVCEMVDFLKEL